MREATLKIYSSDDNYSKQTDSGSYLMVVNPFEYFSPKSDDFMLDNFQIGNK